MTDLMNNIRVIGFLEKKPVLKKLEDNKYFVKISILGKDLIRTKNDKLKLVPKRQKLVLWGEQAQLVVQQLEKGSEVSLEGRLVNGIRVNEEDIAEYFTDVDITDIYIFKNKEKIKLVKQNIIKQRTFEIRDCKKHWSDDQFILNTFLKTISVKNIFSSFIDVNGFIDSDNKYWSITIDYEELYSPT